ncbi:MAG: OsmC family protein [Bacteroidales bacterium]|nr:OsmC family protein [Bacteroidales bacterium]
MDKSKNLLVTLDLMNEKVRFNGLTEGQSPVSIDYVPPLGDNQGYTSLELLLLSLGSCVGSALLMFLRKMGKTIDGLAIRMEADRRAEHPTILTSIHLKCFFTSPDLQEADLNKVVPMAEEKYCPVYAMLKGNTQITISCFINR